MRLDRWIPLLLAALLWSGCAGYQLGPTGGLVAGERSVQINPIGNQTVEPYLGEAITAALRGQFQHDATFKLATRADGDIVVTGVVTRYHRRELSLLPDDVLTAKDYRVSLTAKITAKERSSGKILLDQTLTGETLLRVGSDLASAERQALALLAEDVARKVVALLADGTW